MKRNHTSVRHLSYEELDTMMRGLAETMKATGKYYTLWPTNASEGVLTHLLSEYAGYPVDNSKDSLRVSLVSEASSNVCLFKKNHVSPLMDKQIKFYADEIFQEDDETFMKITLPWRKA